MKILNEIDCDECEYCVVFAYNNNVTQHSDNIYFDLRSISLLTSPLHFLLLRQCERW